MSKRFLLILSLFVFAAALFAQEKRGYVNMEILFNEYYKTINENINFEKQQRGAAEALEVLRKEYTNTLDELRKAKERSENPLLSQEDRTKAVETMRILEERLRQKVQEVQTFRDTKAREIGARQQNTTAALLNELVEQVKKYAAEKGYTEVVEVSGRSLNRVPMLLVYPKEHDFTQQLVKVVNAGHEKEYADSKARLEELRKQRQPLPAGN